MAWTIRRKTIDKINTITQNELRKCQNDVDICEQRGTRSEIQSSLKDLDRHDEQSDTTCGLEVRQMDVDRHDTTTTWH